MADERKEQDEGEGFVPPTFDEDAFIHREVVSFRTTTMLFLLGFAAALASWGAFALLHGNPRVGWPAGLAICAVFAAALKPLFGFIKADISHWGKREWLGTAFLYFFSWLAFFIIAVNPPISDYAAPSVNLHANPAVQVAGGVVGVDLFVEDNVHVKSYDIEMRKGGQSIALPQAVDLGHGHLRYELASLPPGTYRLDATARDGRGGVGIGNGTFTVVETTMDVELPSDHRLDGTDQVVVTTHGIAACATKNNVVTQTSCVRAVRLEWLNRDGNLSLDAGKSTASTVWRADKTFAGWQSNNTFRVVAELADDFQDSHRISGGQLRAEGPFTLDVPGGSSGDFVPAVPKNLDPAQRSAPGAALPLVAVLLLGLAATRKR